MIAHRSPGALDEDLLEVDACLRSWGQWALQGRTHIGWPRVSISGRMLEWHRLGIRPDSGGHVAVEMPPGIERMDRLIAKLPEIQKKVVVVHYTSDQPFEVKCRKVQATKSSYYRWLDRARYSLRLGLKL